MNAFCGKTAPISYLVCFVERCISGRMLLKPLDGTQNALRLILLEVNLSDSKKAKSFDEKVQLLDMHQEGKSYASKDCHYDINENTICYIKKNDVVIRSTVAVSFSESPKKIMTVIKKHYARK